VRRLGGGEEARWRRLRNSKHDDGCEDAMVAASKLDGSATAASERARAHHASATPRVNERAELRCPGLACVALALGSGETVLVRVPRPQALEEEESRRQLLEEGSLRSRAGGQHATPVGRPAYSSCACGEAKSRRQSEAWVAGARASTRRCRRGGPRTACRSLECWRSRRGGVSAGGGESRGGVVELPAREARVLVHVLERRQNRGGKVKRRLQGRGRARQRQGRQCPRRRVRRRSLRARRGG
jgi:hypothetical protein